MIFNIASGFPWFPILQYTVNGTTYEAGSSDFDNGIWKVRHDSNRTLIWLRYNGTFTFKRLKPGTANLFLCGPGAIGGYASEPNNCPHGGVGGAGGQRIWSSISYSSNQSVSVHVATDYTSFGSISAAKGGGSAGGAGGWSSEEGAIVGGSAGGNGYYAWDDSSIDGVLYGAGGGGGMGAYYVSTRVGPYQGGYSGGCWGVGYDHFSPTPTANTGGGGGGGCNDRGAYYNPVDGATGIVILSIPR